MACFRFVNGKLCHLLVPIGISLVSSYVAFFRLTYRHSCANAVGAYGLPDGRMMPCVGNDYLLRSFCLMQMV